MEKKSESVKIGYSLLIIHVVNVAGECYIVEIAVLNYTGLTSSCNTSFKNKIQRGITPMIEDQPI